MTCDQALQVQAYVDGELDALRAADVERHIESCAECARLRADLEGLRTKIRGSATYYRAGDLLQRRVHNAVGGEAPSDARPTARRSFWFGALSGGVATALAASLVVAALVPSAQDLVAEDMLSAHLRSLMGTHLIDVASNNHHVVKPWFAGHVDFSPPVANFAKDGFDLVGGRLDYVHGKRTAVLVYRHGGHVANVFVWKDETDGYRGLRVLDGYHLLAWKSGNLDFCVVSDMTETEVDRLSQLIKENRPA